MSSEIEMQQVLLGARPFVLLEVEWDENDEPQLRMKAGGGIESNSEIVEILEDVLESLRASGETP
jgi:hypothetical protein